MLRIYLVLCLMICSLIEFSYASSKVMCPAKILDTLTVEGTYLGFFEDEEVNSVGIRIGKDDVYIMCSEAKANAFFGDNKGKKVSLTYDLEQFFLEYDESGDCMRMEICQKGSLVESIKERSQINLNSTASYDPLIQAENIGNMLVKSLKCLGKNTACNETQDLIFRYRLKNSGVDPELFFLYLQRGEKIMDRDLSLEEQLSCNETILSTIQMFNDFGLTGCCLKQWYEER